MPRNTADFHGGADPYSATTRSGTYISAMHDTPVKLLQEWSEKGMDTPVSGAVLDKTLRETGRGPESVERNRKGERIEKSGRRAMLGGKLKGKLDGAAKIGGVIKKAPPKGKSPWGDDSVPIIKGATWSGNKRIK